jgi:hypothetical protein
MTWGSVGCEHLFRLEREYGNVIFRISTDELVAAELKEFSGRLSREREDDTDTALSKDIDLPASIFGIASPYSEKRLNRIVCESTYLGGDAISSNIV